MTGALDVADNLLERLHGLAGNNKLVLQEAAGTVAAVPLANQVQRLVELREVLHLVLVGARFQPPQLTNGDHAELVHGERWENIWNGD